MKKDISIPKVKDVGIAIIKEIKENELIWMVYLINFNDHQINDVLVSSRGYGIIGEIKKRTSTFSHSLGHLLPKSYKLIEPISENVFGLSNEFLVTYYVKDEIYDKKYIFLPETILKKNFTSIPILDKQGVLIK